MSLPSTKCLDHIIHLTPPGSLNETAEEFRNLGFKVLPGGSHAGGLSENSLVILADGVYLELISFVRPVDAYPPGSPTRLARENHQWALKAPGWIDYAFLGHSSGTVRISDIINDRAKAGGDDVMYGSEQPGGRTRPDGEVLKWILTPPLSPAGDPARWLPFPFFCADVTSRELRVPSNTSSNTEHPCTAEGIAFVRFQVPSDKWDYLSRSLDYVIGSPGITTSDAEREWQLDVVKGHRDRSCRLLLSVGESLGISEVAFYVKDEPPTNPIQTPYGQIRFVVF